jgi:hypothetical protein
MTKQQAIAYMRQVKAVEKAVKRGRKHLSLGSLPIKGSRIA